MTAAGVGHDPDTLHTALWLLVVEAGHLGCDGWTFDDRAGLLTCACGASLYELRRVGGPTGRYSRPSAGRIREERADDPR